MPGKAVIRDRVGMTTTGKRDAFGSTVIRTSVCAKHLGEKLDAHENQS